MTPIDLSILCKDEAAKALVDLWLQLSEESVAATGRRIPAKSAFTPMKIARYLPYIFMLEWTDTGALQIRLAGTAFSAHFGRNLTGLKIDDLPTSLLTKGEMDYFRVLHTFRCAGSHEVLITDKKSAKPVLYRSIHLPLADANGQPRFIIGASRALPPHMMSKTGVEMRLLRDEGASYHFADLGFGSPMGGRLFADVA
ncbi:PAS domain-containing protein [Pseudokordiimonas caeni]|uniref:PAS domain-containing protein n=1 Tax=Pseudokordiimonas caeni TaxID=2997908 RepID=UPI002812057B|nr:PAS domain-containing protein [Pseudokordiimonas caeni]